MRIRRFAIPLCLLISAINIHATDLTINAQKSHQSVLGIGGALAMYTGWFTANPYKQDLYDSIFGDLQISFLRLRNDLDHSANSSIPADSELVAEARKRLGRSFPLLLTSWTPPSYLKSNGSLADNGSGTLAQTNGAYNYQGFGNYWKRSIERYIQADMWPDYISIQNEPDWAYQNEAMLLDKQEDVTNAGYGPSLAATVKAFDSLAVPIPKILGGEPLGISNSNLQGYVAGLERSSLYGYAHHLYSEDFTNPDGMSTNMQGIQQDLGDKPRFMTEYCHLNADDTINDPINLAWIMRNFFVIEEGSAFVFWDLAWGGGSGGIAAVDNPWDQSTWQSPKGFRIRPMYFALKQYTRFVKPGWTRIDANSSSDDLRMVAFLSTNKDSISLVVVNKASSPDTAIPSIPDFIAGTGSVYQTGNGLKCAPLGTWLPGTSIIFPARSITTLVIAKSAPATINPYQKFEAEQASAISGSIRVENGLGSGGKDLGYIQNGNWARYTGLHFGSGATDIQVGMATPTSAQTGKIEVHLDDTTGPLVATIVGASQGGWQSYTTIKTPLTNVSGTHDLVLVFRAQAGQSDTTFLLNLDWILFDSATTPQSSSSSSLQQSSSSQSPTNVMKSADAITMERLSGNKIQLHLSTDAQEISVVFSDGRTWMNRAVKGSQEIVIALPDQSLGRVAWILVKGNHQSILKAIPVAMQY